MDLKLFMHLAYTGKRPCRVPFLPMGALGAFLPSDEDYKDRKSARKRSARVGWVVVVRLLRRTVQPIRRM